MNQQSENSSISHYIAIYVSYFMVVEINDSRKMLLYHTFDHISIHNLISTMYPG